MKDKIKFFACVIRQYGTGLYRACVRVDDQRLIYLGAYQNETSANEMMSRFLEAERKGEVTSPEDITEFIRINGFNPAASQPSTSPELLLAA